MYHFRFNLSSNLIRCISFFYNEKIEAQRKGKLIKVTLLLSSDTKICTQADLALEPALLLTHNCVPGMWPQVNLCESAIF